MTLRQLVTGILDHDLYEMYIWALWFFNPKRVPCVSCINARCNTGDDPPDCAACIPPANLIKKRFKTLEKEKQNENDQQKNFKR